MYRSNILKVPNMIMRLAGPQHRPGNSGGWDLFCATGIGTAVRPAPSLELLFTPRCTEF